MTCLTVSLVLLSAGAAAAKTMLVYWMKGIQIN